MDKIANRPRGFAFLRYATEEDSQKAIKGMHGKVCFFFYFFFFFFLLWHVFLWKIYVGHDVRKSNLVNNDGFLKYSEYNHKIKNYSSIIRHVYSRRSMSCTIY